MKKGFYGPFFRTVRQICRWIFPHYQIDWGNIPAGPVVFISHHQNMLGPITNLIWLDQPVHIWALAVFCDKTTCYQQYTQYTFTKRFGWPKWLACLCAAPLSLFISAILKDGQAIPVYRGSRDITKTFRLSQQALGKGEPLLIFPDIDYSSNAAEVGDIYNGFLHLEKDYYQETGQHLPFVPLYVDKNSHRILAAAPILFPDDVPFLEARTQIAKKLQQSLNQLAQADSTHTIAKGEDLI